MIYTFYSVFDKGAEEYSVPFPAKNNAIAGRNFQQFLDRVPDTLKLDDFDLFYLFTWDDDTGIVTENTPKCVAFGSLFERTKDKQ